MIKGINRQMIEVTGINDSYYERAYLVIKPEYSDYREDVLQKEAKKLVKSFGSPSSAKKKTNLFHWIIRAGLAAAVGALVTAVAMIW